MALPGTWIQARLLSVRWAAGESSAPLQRFGLGPSMKGLKLNLAPKALRHAKRMATGSCGAWTEVLSRMRTAIPGRANA
jgi:hypothetical protein